MKERPIIFNGPMVQAILAGRKAQTRRVVKTQPPSGVERLARTALIPPRDDGTTHEARWMPGMLAAPKCPYGQPGDRLWVREAWTTRQGLDGVPPRSISRDQSVGYIADLEDAPWLGRIRPSIHMPRWASRITLEITAIRVERLQDISESDAMAEGVDIDVALSCGCSDGFSAAFSGLWESIKGPGSWDANPWVWVVEFKRIDQEVSA